MGIFDKGNKKKKDEFDGPVEHVDLSAGVQQAEATAAPAAAASAAQEPAAPDKPAATSNYGIDDAIQLMRALPADNVELVVRVVKSTLESTNIEIKTIIEDASNKQKRIEDRVAVLKSEIGELESEIKSRKTEIDSLESDHSETTQVKERLLLAEKLGSGASTQPGSGAPNQTSSGSGSGPFGKSGSEPPRPRRSSTSPPPTPGAGGASTKTTGASGSSSKTTVVSKK